MRAERVEWQGPERTAAALRRRAAAAAEAVDVGPIERDVRSGGDEALLRLTARFDATETPPTALRVDAEEIAAAPDAIPAELRRALETAAANVRAVAAAQAAERQEVELPQGHRVAMREVAVRAAGVYAPGGRAAYPSSVLMCAIPARVAGVERIALATPPGPAGKVADAVLAAAALCEVDEVYAMGGAQAIFGLAYGTETIAPVDVIAGPGNAWVREAKRAVYGQVGIDSLAGPSELMIVAGGDTNVDWAALDLCAQAEHGADSPLAAVAVEDEVLEGIAAAALRLAAERPSVKDAELGLVQVPDLDAAIALANELAPEHLELLSAEAADLAARLTTPGCIFSGAFGATAFGDYAAGSNHVLPTAGAGRFSGPLGPAVFRRRISEVRMSPAAAAELAPHIDAIARAEGLPVHGESAMIRR